MPNEVLRAARNRLAELQDEIAELQSFVRMYHKLALSADHKPAPAHAIGAGPVMKGDVRRSQTAETADQALVFIEQDGRPIRLNQMLRRFEQAGITIPGKNPAGTGNCSKVRRRKPSVGDAENIKGKPGGEGCREGNDQ